MDLNLLASAWSSCLPSRGVLLQHIGWLQQGDSVVLEWEFCSTSFCLAEITQWTFIVYPCDAVWVQLQNSSQHRLTGVPNNWNSHLNKVCTPFQGFSGWHLVAAQELTFLSIYESEYTVVCTVQTDLHVWALVTWQLYLNKFRLPFFVWWEWLKRIKYSCFTVNRAHDL